MSPNRTGSNAMVRATSQPVPSNPFWSERVMEEVRLDEARPEELPVPADDDWTERGEGMTPRNAESVADRILNEDESSTRGRPSERAARPDRSRSAQQVKSGETGRQLSQRLKTPTSWCAGKETDKSSKSSEPEENQESLERAVEREMMRELKHQNELLRQQVEWMQTRVMMGSSTSWSTVSMPVESPAPPPPPPQTPVQETPMMTPMSPSDVNKFTPNGTRVPVGSPPKTPVMPAWPQSLSLYDREDSGERMRAMRDDRVWQPTSLRGASFEGRALWRDHTAAHGECGGGAWSRQEQVPGSKECGRGALSRQKHLPGSEECGRGAWSRQAHLPGSEECGHGARSRQEQVPGCCESGRGAQSRQEQGLHGQDFAHGRWVSLQQGGVQQWDVPMEATTRPPPPNVVQGVVLPEEPQLGRIVQGQGEGYRQLLQQSHQQASQYRWGLQGQQEDVRNPWDRPPDRLGRTGHPDDEARQRYWNTPVDRYPAGGSATGAQARGIMDEVMNDFNSRTYTQEEVKQLLEEAKKERAASQKVREDRVDEGLRSFQVTLPVLPEPTVKNASLEAGDWLTQIRPLVSDVSGAAAGWWSKVLAATSQQYHKWLGATPLDKLNIEPPDNEILAAGHERLAQRIGVMLLQALPSGLRQEMIAARRLDCANILFKIFKAYQPGGLAERRRMLSQLTETSAAKTPAEAVQSLRHWKRQAQRAAELHATLPDAVIQVKALTEIMENLLQRDSQASFRVSSYRMNHGIDIAPTDQDVCQFFDLLLAEAEHMVTSMGEMDMPPLDTISGQPQVRALHQQGSPAKPKSGSCKFWGTESGCRSGRNCNYNHDWQALTDKADRCWICSGKGHRKTECPAQAKKEDQMQAASGGSGGGTGAEKGNESMKGGKGKRKGQTKGQGKNSPKKEEKIEDTGKNGDKEDNSQPSIKAEKVTSGSAPTSQQEEGTSSGSTGGQEALMSEVTSLLRSIRVQGGDPQVKMMSIKRLQPEGEGGHTLIDGGATHCLRRKKDDQEWREAVPVTVKLASGEVKMRQHPTTSTLLVEDYVQAIVPVAKIVDCGYVVKWDKESCKIEHARHGKVPVEMDQGCPTVGVMWGERLMQEIEDAERKKAKIRAIMRCGVLAEDDFEKQVAELQVIFPSVPMRILERIPGEKNWDPDQVPFNRRRRRQIARANQVIINMCSGPDGKRWKELEKEGTVVINLDVLLGVNVMDPHVRGWIEEIIDSGKVIMWTAGPPCRTISLCRQRGITDGGPKPLRSRQGEGRFGLPGLTGSQQDLADHDTALWLKNLWYMRRVKRKNPEAEVLLEQPQDPKEWASWAGECPSFLVWPETKQLVRDLSLNEVRISQGEMGHATNKPTTLITDIPEIEALEDQVKNESKGKPWPKDLSERLGMSKELSKWAPGLVEVLKMAMRRKVMLQPRLQALTAKEKEAIESWKLHMDMNHCPYRRDCAICVEAMGQDRPHKRQKVPEPFTLALDLSGPFVKGVDQIDHHNPRYFLIAAMTIPIADGKPLVEGLRRLAGEADQHVELPKPPGHQEDDKELEDAQECKPGEDGVDPFAEEKDPKQEDEAPLSEAQVKQLDEENQKWKAYLAEVHERPVKTLTLAVPVKSKHTSDVIKATSQVVARLRSLHIPRVHTDRGREFTGKAFKDWLAQRDYFHTTTAGDEPAANARAESEIKVLKNRARVLMKSARCEAQRWPLAIRYAAEERFRKQLRECGVPVPPMLSFGLEAYAKKKSGSL